MSFYVPCFIHELGLTDFVSTVLLDYLQMHLQRNQQRNYKHTFW